MKMIVLSASLVAALFLIGVDAQAAGVSAGHTQKGIASYYHNSLHGRKTASGQIYNKNKLSAAHKTLPLGTKVRVTDVKTGREIVVRINDRGPFVKGRVIDLSRSAAKELGIIQRGVAKVEVEVLSVPSRRDS
jgi:rare lipoprotein A